MTNQKALIRYIPQPSDWSWPSKLKIQRCAKQKGRWRDALAIYDTWYSIPKWVQQEAKLMILELLERREMPSMCFQCIQVLMIHFGTWLAIWVKAKFKEIRHANNEFLIVYMIPNLCMTSFLQQLNSIINIPVQRINCNGVILNFCC